MRALEDNNLGLLHERKGKGEVLSMKKRGRLSFFVPSAQVRSFDNRTKYTPCFLGFKPLT